MGVIPEIASGTIYKKFGNKWYAPDEKGVFRFEVNEDKALYPTNRILADGLVMAVDTHGINALVEQAIRNKVDFVVGCCDSVGKIDAANYLVKKGIKVICFTDRFAYLDLNQNKSIITSAPITSYSDYTIIGNRTLKIKSVDTIIAMNATGNAQMYYDTPARYFQELSKYYKVNVKYVTIDDNNQMGKVIAMAKETKANVIAVRIFDSDDYNKVKAWLAIGLTHKAILFHSMPYPYGVLLFKEFPYQTTFGDINIEAN
jgi:hypothetical protein